MLKNTKAWCDGCLAEVTTTPLGYCPTCKTDFFINKHDPNDDKEVWDY